MQNTFTIKCKQSSTGWIRGVVTDGRSGNRTIDVFEVDKSTGVAGDFMGFTKNKGEGWSGNLDSKVSFLVQVFAGQTIA